MFALISLIVILIVSLVIVRVGTVALTMTGLTPDLARFQARSAFTNTGFATQESEHIMKHPVRRQIVMLLMLTGNAGFVTVISSLVLSFMNTDVETHGIADAIWFRMIVITLVLLILWGLSRTAWLDRRMSAIIGWALNRWTTLDVRDYASLLHLHSDHVVAEIKIDPGSWLENETLKELKLSAEGVLVLAIGREDGTFISAPRGDQHLETQDTLIIYGRREQIQNLDKRRAGSRGNQEHVDSVAEQKVAESSKKIETPTAAK